MKIRNFSYNRTRFVLVPIAKGNTYDKKTLLL